MFVYVVSSDGKVIGRVTTLEWKGKGNEKTADSSINSGNAHLIDTLPNGYADYWGMTGYPTDTGIAATNAFTWRTDLNSNYKNDWKTYTGIGYFYWEVRINSTSDQLWMIDYGNSNPKYGMITWWELAV